MGKRHRESVSDGETPMTEECNTVFVDTSLDTHLAMLVSSSDTVLDFKKKMMLEHVQCFPKIGEIEIHSLKVKRRGNFYHLPDIMLLWSAFGGVKGNWFLSADVSGALTCCIQEKSTGEHGTNDDLMIIVRNIADENCKNLSSNVNSLPALEMSLPLVIAKKHDMSEITAGIMVKNSSKKINTPTNSLKYCTESNFYAKKRKVGHNDTVCCTPLVEDKPTVFHECHTLTLQPEIVGCENSMDDDFKESPQGIRGMEQQEKTSFFEPTTDVSCVQNYQPDTRSRVAFKETFVLSSAAENSNLGCIVVPPGHLSSDEQKEDTLMGSTISDKCPTELGQNVLYGNMEGVIVKDPNLSGRSIYANGRAEDASPGVIIKNKMKAKKTAPEICDASHLEHETGKSGRITEKAAHIAASNLENNFNSQNLVPADKQENDAMLESATMKDFMDSKSENHFHLGVPTSHSEGFIIRESNDSARLMDDHGPAEGANANSRKKKKEKAKKAATVIQGTSHMEHETGKVASIDGTLLLASVENINAGRTLSSQTVLPSDERKECKEDSPTEKSENEFGQNTSNENSEDLTLKEPNLQARVTDVTVAEPDAKSVGNKKKKKAKNRVAKIQDSLDVEYETQKGENVEGTPVLSSVESINTGRTLISQTVLPSDESKECTKDSTAAKSENEFGRNTLNENSEGLTFKDPNLPARAIDATVAEPDAKSVGSKKKKKAKKTVAKIQDTLDMEYEFQKGENVEGTPLLASVESINAGRSMSSQTVLPSDERKECTKDSIAENSENNFGRNTLNENSECLTFKDPNLPARAIDATVAEPDAKSVGIKKKKKAKKTVAKIQDTLDMEYEFQKGENVEGTPLLASVESINAGRTLSSQTVLRSDERKECTKDSIAGKSENNFGRNTLNEYSEGLTFKDPNLPTRASDATVAEPDAKSVGIKKKKKAKKTVSRIQDTLDMEYETQEAENVERSIVSAVSGKPNLENLTSDKMKKDNLLDHVTPENLAATTSEVEHVLNESSKVISMGEPNVSSRLHDTRVIFADYTSNGSKKTKRKTKAAAEKLQDTADMEYEIRQHERGQHQNETSQHKEDEAALLSVTGAQEMMLPSHDDVSGSFDPNLVRNEASSLTKLSNADAMKPEGCRGSKKKKKGKKYADLAVSEKSGKEPIDNIANGSVDHMQAETEGGETIVPPHPKENDAELKVLDISNGAVDEKALEADDIGKVSVLTQTEQILEDVAAKKTKQQKKNQTSEASHASMPVIGKENHVREFEQAESNSWNAINDDNKIKNRRRKRELRELEVQENLSVKDSKVPELLAAMNKNTFVDSEQESSQVQFDKSKAKYEVPHGTATSTLDLVRPHHDGQEIDFKQYFVPGETQDKVASGNKVKPATKSNKAGQTGTRVEKNSSGSVSNTGEVQNSHDNQESECGSRLRTNGDKRQGDTELDSASTSRSLGVPGNEVGNSVSKDILETTADPKHKKGLAVSSGGKHLDTSLAKSNSIMSDRFPENMGNRKFPMGLNVINRMGTNSLEKKNLFSKSGSIFQVSSESFGKNELVMKTPGRNRLLTKSIFQGSSSEGSGYENGRVDSDATTCSPSDSSSLSDAGSDGDGELSVDSARNESNDANGIPAGGKSMSKLDLSASKEMTMDMLLRSSKRFKKAKLIASQELHENDMQDIEFVPETQPDP